jgi:hypothetical protein
MQNNNSSKAEQQAMPVLRGDEDLIKLLADKCNGHMEKMKSRNFCYS